MQLIAADGCGQILLVIFLRIAFNRCGLVSADGVFLIPTDLVCLLASDVDVLIPSDSMIFLTSDIGIKSAVEVLRRLSCHGGGQLAAYGIRHIAGGIVHDILCIVCDGAVFGCIGNSIRLHLNGRFLPSRSDIMPNLISSLIDGARAFVIGHRCLFSIYRLLIGQRFKIPICILVLDRNGVSFCRFLFKIGFISIDKLLLALGRSLRISMRIPIRVCHLVRHTICCHLGSGYFPVAGAVLDFGIIDRPFFIVGELALGGIAMFCYFSQIRDPIRLDGGSTIMLFTGCCIQLIIFQVDLAYIELAIDRQVFLYGDIAFRGQFVSERGLASDFQIAADDSILCGRDLFSRQLLHIFDIALVIHFDTAFDGGLGAFQIPSNTAGPIIGGIDSIFTILNFLVDLLIQCCIGCNAISNLRVNLMIQCRIGCNAISNLRVDLMIQRRIGCNAISSLRVDLTRQFRIFRFQRINIRLRCCHICLQSINIRFGSCHTSRKVSQGCICGYGLGFQIINSRFIRINFRCISSDLTIQLICSSLQSCDIVFVRSDIACFEGFDLFINLSLGIEMVQRLIYI